MQITVNPVPSQQFKPVSVTIVFENIYELIDMWHRTNLSPQQINKESPAHRFRDSYYSATAGSYELWKIINQFVERAEKETGYEG